jgi:hypothetical protein
VGNLSDRELLLDSWPPTKNVAINIPWTHCSIQRYALASKYMAMGLKSVLENAVKVNFIMA